MQYNSEQLLYCNEKSEHLLKLRDLIRWINFVLIPQGPPTDAPAVDTAEQVYISSLALLKVITLHLLYVCLHILLKYLYIYIYFCSDNIITFLSLFVSRVCSTTDVEARACWCTNGGHGTDAGRICWWLHSASDRCVCHAPVRNSMYPNIYTTLWPI